MKLLQKSINARRKAAKKVFLRPILFLMKNKFLAEITFSIFFLRNLFFETQWSQKKNVHVKSVTMKFEGNLERERNVSEYDSYKRI